MTIHTPIESPDSVDNKNVVLKIILVASIAIAIQTSFY
jgi:hypothetical protein